MNLLEAEEKLKEYKPHIAYLSHGTIGKEKEGEMELYKYLALKTKIFEAKQRYHLLPLEFSLDCMLDEKEFFHTNILPMLYKDHVSDENLDYCKEKLLELDEGIEELNSILKHRKVLAKL